MRSIESLQNRAADFWSRIEKSGDCWIWTARRFRTGYGRFDCGGYAWGAHRVAMALTTGEIPELCVLHRCDNPPCVNPAHLWLGTLSDNTRDAYSKGRMFPPDTRRLGERHPHSKLNREMVRDIRRRIAQGDGYALIARAFGVSQRAIVSVATGRTWRHVP